MEHGEYKKILFQVFELLGYTEPEKEMALEGVKRRFYLDLLNMLKDKLSADDQAWINDNLKNKTPDLDRAQEINKNIKTIYPEDELQAKSKQVFKAVLVRYTNFMSSRLSSDDAGKLEEIVNSI